MDLLVTYEKDVGTLRGYCFETEEVMLKMSRRIRCFLYVLHVF